MSFSSLAISASARAGKQSTKNVDIIEFVHQVSLGLEDETLSCAKEVILKAHYGNSLMM